MIDLPTALYVISIVSFCCPQDVRAKALRMLFLLDTLSATWLLCLMNDSEVSRWTPKIVRHSTRCKSSMSIFGWVLAWCVSGVNNVTDGFGAEINRELFFRYAVISSRELFRLSSMSGILNPVVHTVMSTVYQTRLTASVGVGTSAM